MALTGETKYKILYNTFLTNTKNYSEFINTGFIDLYTQKGHGILEESFRHISYEWGNIMNTNPNLVGFPNDSLQRLDNKYIELKNSITAQTTDIQLNSTYALRFKGLSFLSSYDSIGVNTPDSPVVGWVYELFDVPNLNFISSSATANVVGGN